MLQMAFQAVNHTAFSHGLIPNLLVFRAYPRIIINLPPVASHQQRANAMAKAMNELRKLKVQRGVKDTLNAQNGPDTIQTILLAMRLGSKV